MADETFVADDWLFSTLSGDATLAAIVGNRIYPSPPAPSTAYPLIIVELLAAPLRKTADDTVIWVEADYLIKVYVKGRSYNNARAAAFRVNELLHKKRGTTADGIVVSSSRVETQRGAEEESDAQYRWVGGIYQLLAQST